MSKYGLVCGSDLEDVVTVLKSWGYTAERSDVEKPWLIGKVSVVETDAPREVFDDVIKHIALSRGAGAIGNGRCF